MNTREKRYVGELSIQDLELLYQLYKYRALSTAQIAVVGNLGKWYVYKKLRYLKNLGYLYSEQITGNYIPNQRRQGSYFRISGKGITLLRKNGYSVDSTADDLKVTRYRIPYLLTANELALSLTNAGWKYKDSREIKKSYDLNKTDILQGSLINSNKDKEYALYILFKKVYRDTLSRIKSEINRNRFENVLLTTRGELSFRSVIKSFMNSDDRVIKGGSVKVLPFGFAKIYLTISSDNKQMHQSFINKQGIKILESYSNKSSSESKVVYDYLVSHNGEEKYFIDLLDNDLMKIHDLKYYRKEDYERDGRKVLVLTSNADFHLNFHKQILDHVHHIDYLSIDPKQVVTYANLISDKSLFE